MQEIELFGEDDRSIKCLYSNNEYIVQFYRNGIFDVYERKGLTKKGSYKATWNNEKDGEDYDGMIRSACEGSSQLTVAMCGDNGFLGEFDLSIGIQTKAFKEMFNGDEAQVILKVGMDDNFAVGTISGVFVVDMQNGSVILHIIKEKSIFGMAYAGNGLLIAGASKEDRD